MSFKYENQHGMKDCGVACLYNIIKYYNGYINMSKLRKVIGTNENGTSVYNIVKAARNLGLKSEAYKCNIDNLLHIRLPVIAYIKIQNKYGHFVIVDKICNDKIIIYDPIRNKTTYHIYDFKKEWTGVIITFDKTNYIVNEKKYKYITKYICMHRKIIFVFIFLTVLTSLFSLINSFYLSLLYNQKLNYNKILLLFLFFSFCKIIIDYIRNNIILNYDKKFDSMITNSVYKKILSLPIKYHHSRPVGDIISRINDISYIKEFINITVFSFIIDIIYIVIIFFTVFIINKILFLLLIISTLIYIFIYLIFKEKVYKVSSCIKEEQSMINSYLVESIIGIDTIKNLNVEKEKNIEFNSRYNCFLETYIKYNKFLLNLELFQNFIITITNVLVLYIGIKLVNKGLLLFSNLIIINSILIYFFISLKNILNLDRILIDAKNSYNRLKDLINEDEEKNSTSYFNIENSIKFQNISYCYDTHNNILSNVNLKILKGDYIFIKGDSGVGKSTLFKILTKQIENYKGKIFIDNINLKKINVHDIKDNICFVSQDETIFTDTISNNIKMFKNDIKNDINKVIKITGINEMLKIKDISLDFLLEENGHNISGGERQRILLARALLQNKKILILDETMNGIDVKSERNILKKIKEEFNITLILISHRNDNIDLFNKVYEIKGGTCEEVK